MSAVAVYSEKYFLSAGEANAEQELSLPVLATKIIDIATAHANSLGIGNPDMADMHSGWVLSRLTIEMERYPKVNDTYGIETWVEGWNRHFSQRAFRIFDEKGATLGYARSIWMVFDTLTHQNVGLSHLHLPEGIIMEKECPIDRQRPHIPILPSPSDGHELPKNALAATVAPSFYTFRYCDLDSYRHVNTVRYIDALLNQFPLERYDSHILRRLELSFLHEGAYGMTVRIMRHDFNDRPSSALSICNAADGGMILFSRFTFRPR